MSFDDFKAFKSVASKMVTARICGVTLDVTMSNIFLSQDTVHAQFSCISLAETFVPPKFPKSNSGWIEEDPHKLARILEQLDVAPSSVDDVVTLQVSENKLLAGINTETLEAELQISLASGKDSLNGPIFEAKRQLFINCLRSFSKGQFVEIHGFLTEDTNIILRSKMSEDYVLMAKMPHVTSISS